jgi:exodeoxyribonuclease-5
VSAAEIVLSEDQQRALDRIEEWFSAKGGSVDDAELSLGGLAGTGKTTLVARMLERGPTVLAPTAKACSVLRRKGVPASTIHSAIYTFAGIDSSGHRPVLEFDEKGRGFAGLLIVDEASMVTRPVADDLRRAAYRRNGKILWVGDHGQLPPVGEDPKILANPDLRLEKIHRQAEASPILQVAHAVRGGQRLVDAAAQHASEGHVRAVHCPSMLHLEELIYTARPDIVLVARNDTRRAVNRIGYKLSAPEGWTRDYPYPYLGAPLIALRNSHKAGIINGEQYELKVFDDYGEDDEFTNVTLRDFLGSLTGVQCWLPALGQGVDTQLASSSDVPYDVALVDYAWATTVHKAQGSEFSTVLVVDETVSNKPGWDHSRWGYTAATRAKQQLIVVRLGR